MPSSGDGGVQSSTVLLFLGLFCISVITLSPTNRYPPIISRPLAYPTDVGTLYGTSVYAVLNYDTYTYVAVGWTGQSHNLPTCVNQCAALLRVVTATGEVTHTSTMDVPGTSETAPISSLAAGINGLAVYGSGTNLTGLSILGFPFDAGFPSGAAAYCIVFDIDTMIPSYAMTVTNGGDINTGTVTTHPDESGFLISMWGTCTTNWLISARGPALGVTQITRACSSKQALVASYDDSGGVTVWSSQGTGDIGPVVSVKTVGVRVYVYGSYQTVTDTDFTIPVFGEAAPVGTLAWGANTMAVFSIAYVWSSGYLVYDSIAPLNVGSYIPILKNHTVSRFLLAADSCLYDTISAFDFSTDAAPVARSTRTLSSSASCAVVVSEYVIASGITSFVSWALVSGTMDVTLEDVNLGESGWDIIVNAQTSGSMRLSSPSSTGSTFTPLATAIDVFVPDGSSIHVWFHIPAGNGTVTRKMYYSDAWAANDYVNWDRAWVSAGVVASPVNAQLWKTYDGLNDAGVAVYNVPKGVRFV